MDPLTAGWLSNLQRADGRALPGYEPGLIPMQKHLAAAMVRFLTTYDDAWGETPDAGFLAVEMGGGKSTISLAIAHILHQMHLAGLIQ